MGAPSAVEWSWCLDLVKDFSALLDIAVGLTVAQQRPGEESETGGRLLNLYLVVCALDQILSDHLHRGFLDLTPLATGQVGQKLLRAVSAVQHAVRRRTATLRSGRMLRRQRDLQELALTLASKVLAGERSFSREAIDAVTRLRAARWPSQLANSCLQVPRCFRGADLFPADADLLARRASEMAGSQKEPVLIVGLRPDGHYLAPLCAAALRRLGHDRVWMVSLRPGVPLIPVEARRVRRAVARGAWAMLLAGPGGDHLDVASAVDQLIKRGLPEARTFLVSAGHGSRPPYEVMSPQEPTIRRRDLYGVRYVVVEPGELHIEALLSEAAIEEWLNRPQMLQRLGAEAAAVIRDGRYEAGGGFSAVGVEANRRPSAGTLKLFEVELRTGGHRWTEMLLGRGVGLGFFGYHSWLVAACLRDLVPEAVGINDGVLLLRWEPGEGPPDPVQVEDLAEIAAYVATRARRLDLGPWRDIQLGAASVPTAGRQLARLLARDLGPASRLASARVAESITRHIRPLRQVAIDGRMGPAEWVRDGHRHLAKLDFEEHGVDAADRCLADPVHDLASTVVCFRLEPDEEAELVEAYVRLSGDSHDIGARMAVQKLLAGSTELSAVRALGLDMGSRAGRAAYARELAIRETLLARAVNGYLANLYLDGVGSDCHGPVWLIDMDGAVEGPGLGFDCLSPASAMALRLLLAYDQEVFLISSRSLGEVRERCRTFGLAGGVAEHGSVAWDEHRQEVTPLLSSEARQAVGQLREALQEETGLLLDPRYGHSLSLFEPARAGLAGADATVVREVVQRHKLVGLEVVEGVRRTVVRAVGPGRRAAFERLRARDPAESSRRILHVVTASVDDLGLLRIADVCHVIGKADSPLRRYREELRLRFVPPPAQAGLLHVVESTLQGPGRTSPRHPPPRLEPADQALVDALALRDRSPGRLAYLLRRGALRAFEL